MWWRTLLYRQTKVVRQRSAVVIFVEPIELQLLYARRTYVMPNIDVKRYAAGTMRGSMMLIPALMLSAGYLFGAEAFVATGGFHGRCVSALASSTSASNNNSEKRYRFIKRESKPV